MDYSPSSFTAEIPDSVTLENLTISFTPSKRKKVRKVFISIKGRLVVNNIGKVKEVLLEVVPNYDILSISLEEGTALDVSGIQLLHYVSRGTREVSIQANLDGQSKSLIAMGGFSPIVNTSKLS